MVEDKYKRLLTDLHPLHRTLVSDGTDKALAMISDFLKDLGVSDDQVIFHQFPSGSEVSTWIVPKKYKLLNYGLVQLGKEEKEIVSSKDIPLSVVEYSQPVNKIFDWDGLKDHLFYSEKRPDAIPFVFKYFYRPNFGFGIRKNTYDALDRNAKYRVVIDSEFTDDFLKCLEVVIPGETKESILIMSNVCHPYQVNDSITGVINNLMLIEHFLKRKNHYTLRFGFWPETIGAHAYFSKYIGEKPMFRYAIFTEMLGTNGQHTLQFSRQEKSLIDKAASYVLKKQGSPFKTGRFITIVRNDERVSNGVNLDIPTISLTRWPYDEYHTSDDNPTIINMDKIRESSRVTRDIIEILDQNSILVPNNFFGEPFLTRYGLFQDFKEGPPEENPYMITEDIFSYSDGETNLIEIAEKFNYPWDIVRKIADGLVRKGLFTETNEGKSDEKFMVKIDCVSIKNFKEKAADKQFLERTFTKNEIESCKGKEIPLHHFAAKFAAKGAITKALAGLGMKLGFKDIELIDENDNDPIVRINGNETIYIRISLSHCNNVAVAAAIITRRKRFRR